MAITNGQTIFSRKYIFTLICAGVYPQINLHPNSVVMLTKPHLIGRNVKYIDNTHNICDLVFDVCYYVVHQYFRTK